MDAEYRLQRLVYALVCLRGGATDVEVAYQFLESPDAVVSTSFTALAAPAGTPPEIVRQLNEAINAGLNSPELGSTFVFIPRFRDGLTHRALGGQHPVVEEIRAMCDAAR